MASNDSLTNGLDHGTAQNLPGVEHVDVIVIGAGLAGLTAAEYIIKAGYSCKVLEARDRVGGRTWSPKRETGGVIDLGAAWFNDTNQSGMIGLVRRFNLEPVTQNTSGDVILQSHDVQRFPYGQAPNFPANVNENLAHIRDTIEADCQALDVNAMTPRHIELDKMTFLEYLQKLGGNFEAIATATVWTRAMLGREPEDIGALFFLLFCKAGGGLGQMRSDRKHGGQYLRLREGTQAITTNLAKSLSGVVEYNAPVMTVENGRIGKYQARKIICAIPPPVVKKITFTPELPSAKRQLLESYKHGYYQKVMVIFKSPFWNDLGSCGLIQSFTGPVAVVRDTSVAADALHVLTCFLAGSSGLAWSKRSKNEREEEVLQQLEDVLGPKVREEYADMVGHQWNDEEWTGYGCPSSSIGPGVLSLVGEELTRPAGDVHFAGTETSDVWRGLMEGAIRSGQREAELVVRELKNTTN